MTDGHARIHYFRADGNYSNWTLYSFGDTAEDSSNYNAGNILPIGRDSFGAFFDVRLKDDARDLGFIIHNIRTAEKDPGPDMHLHVAQFREAWVVCGDDRVHTTEPSPDSILDADLRRLRAFWLDRATAAIPPQFSNADWSYTLVHSPEAKLYVDESWQLQGVAAELPLILYAAGLSNEQRERFPHLADYTVLRISAAVEPGTIRTMLKGQIALAAMDSDRRVRWLSGIQHAGVIDDLCFYDGALGLGFDETGIMAHLWAPTASSVELLLYETSSAAEPKQVLPMRNQNNLWTARVDTSWNARYYLFRVRVFTPQERAIVENRVTDPYSVDLALNGAKSRFTNLGDPTTKPPGWDAHRPPPSTDNRDYSIYELHVRDFSASDTSVEEQYRGTYLAFTNPQTRGMQHLVALARAGLKAVHLLPTFHYGSVNEDKTTWKSPGDLSVFPPDSVEQQAQIAAVQKQDAYNWGYDPVHYFAPHGSYASDPDQRVREYRQMVQALHQTGLRVVQDVVFNHTVASGRDDQSVLDKIVPGYYYRLDAAGNVERTSCCHDTASEHHMMEKLIIDCLVQSAREYKIDGFRFDLMGLHFVRNLKRIRQAINELTLENDGVDGSQIYLYGEAWEMGTLSGGARGPNAGQRNLFGLGIGSFNDRIRDAIRGGSPFSEQRMQGFATGLFTNSSLYTSNAQSPEDQLDLLLQQTDWIKISLAGNLRDFTFMCRTGDIVRAADVLYNSHPAGYAAAPIEIINYCSVHDNQTLFDAIQIKTAASESIAQRARRQVLAMSLVMFGQGIPLFQAGDDLLRSKDMDENSFDSGDWFNRLDFSYQTNNWGIGLPIASENEENWPIMRPLLANAALKARPQDIAFSREAFREMLTIRASSLLFRMQTLAEIQSNLRFLNNGPQQIPGLIVMHLEANGRHYGPFSRVLVAFNARISVVRFQHDSLRDLALQLHPVQADSVDPVGRSAAYDAAAGAITVPALTTAIFVK